MLALLAAPAAAALGAAALAYYGAHRVLTGNGRVPLTVRPQSLGLPCEPVSCTTSDGIELKGWFIPASAPSDRTILMCHGWGTNKGAILEGLRPLHDRGFNLLAFDFRTCGESGGEILSVGYLEARDFDAAAAFMRRLRPDDRYGVFGLSMGAMVAFCGAVRHGCFRAIALESPFHSHDQACTRYLMQHSHVPYFPLVPLILFWIRVRLGADPEPLGPIYMTDKVSVPVFAIAGEKDAIAPPELAQTLLARLKQPGEVWVVPGAGHARCAETAGAEYGERLARFYLSSMQ